MISALMAVSSRLYRKTVINQYLNSNQTFKSEVQLQETSDVLKTLHPATYGKEGKLVLAFDEEQVEMLQQQRLEMLMRG